MITAIGRLTVLVDDQEAALRWYRDVLGFEVLHDSTTDGYRYLHIGVPGQDGVGLWLMPATPGSTAVGAQTDGEPLLVLSTDDLDQVVTDLRGHHVEAWDVRDDGDSRSLHMRDIVGNVIVVAEIDSA